MITLKDFKLIKLLGSGGYGKIILGKKRGGVDKKTLYAIKIQCKRDVMNENNEKLIKTEFDVLKQVYKSPFLLTMHYAFETPSKLCTVTDFITGEDFLGLLNKRGPFSIEHTRFYVAELVLAIEQLHSRGIMHRDIKLENMMLDERGHVVLVDYGMALKLDSFNRRAKGKTDTSIYMAPEIIEGMYYDENVDWWSLGVLTYKMITGWPPFYKSENSKLEIYNQIISEEPFKMDKVPADVAEFIAQLLEKDPTRRLGSNGANELKRHSFFKDIDWISLASKDVRAPFNPKNCNIMFLKYLSREVEDLIGATDLEEDTDTLFVSPTILEKIGSSSLEPVLHY